MADNRVTLTFTSEGVDGDIVSLSYTKPLVGGITTETITFVTSATEVDEVTIGTTVGTVGAVAATNFVNAFNNAHNADSSFSLNRVDNVVTVDLTPTAYYYTAFVNDLGTGVIGDAPSTFTVLPNISGQELTNEFTYCYLFEPLMATIQDTDSTTTKIFVDLTVLNTDDSTEVETLLNYGEFDINSGYPLKVDMMEMARQYHESNIYKIGLTSDIASAWETVVSKYKYCFKVKTNGTGDSAGTEIQVRKLPIIGGRDFQNFVPTVSQSQVLSEADYYNIDLSNRFIGYPVIETTLADPTATDSRPTITVTNTTSGCEVKSAIIWKSHLGGWVTWGFKLENKNFMHKYSGNLEVDIFESTSDVNGHIYKPIDYTGVETTNMVQLKSLSLSSDELKVANRINYTPTAYYVTSDGKMELMRISAVSAPLDSKSNGGDFSITLKSIGSLKQHTM
jgi:hypothetical protein